MLPLLPPERRWDAVEVLGDKEHLLLLEAVLAGTAPGQVWVDSAERPRALFAAGPEGHYLVGAPGDPGFIAELRQALQERILPAFRANGWWYFTLYYEPGWEDTVGQLLGPDSEESPGAPVYTHQRYFCWSGDAPTEDVPPDLALLSVHDVLREHRDYAGAETLADWSSEDYGSEEAFLAHGLGVCLARDKTLLGWCTSDCIVPDIHGTLRAEVGIRVQPGHRRRGLGRLLARAMLARCARAGISRVGWHCYAQNGASAATALSAGFREGAAHRVVHLWLNPADGHLANGNLALMLGRYGEAVARYRRALALQAAPPPTAPPSRLLADPGQRTQAYYHAALATALAALDPASPARAQAEALLAAALENTGLPQGGY
mgnify:CR=1 FL=1